MYMKLAQYKINKIILLLIIILILGILGWTGIFIYQNVYKIIILVPELQKLQTQVSFEIIRIDLFEQIMENLQKKIAFREINWLLINNPF